MEVKQHKNYTVFKYEFSVKDNDTTHLKTILKHIRNAFEKSSVKIHSVDTSFDKNVASIKIKTEKVMKNYDEHFYHYMKILFVEFDYTEVLLSVNKIKNKKFVNRFKMFINAYACYCEFLSAFGYMDEHKNNVSINNLLLHFVTPNHKKMLSIFDL